MPAESLEEQGLDKNPNLELAQLKFVLLTENQKPGSFDSNIIEEARSTLLKAVHADDMAPFYEDLCKDLGWTKDSSLAEKLSTANKAKLAEMDAAIVDAEENLGEMEVREANLKKAEYLSKIGDVEAAISAFRKTYEKTVSLGQRLDILFHYIRLGLFTMDHDLINRNIEKAQMLIEEGGDWDRRNRLKVYNGLYCISIRDFKKAANLFLDTVSTFTSYELMDYQVFIKYTVYAAMVALPRNELRDKVVKGSEILEVLHTLQEVRDYLFSLYNCQYDRFFKNLARIEQEIKHDRYFSPHFRYYVKEMRIIAYNQLLDSYRSLTLDYMARAFDVTTEFIDRELARFIAVGRLHARIDRVGGIVETNRPDTKNWQYQSTIKQGDHLLNRIQKLSRVINI
ncbi:hypothetical protein QYM36_003336 [Artemia franciscana]|uniref:26S proteasome non-ATPase regulatory subunit 6 n=1 Tax=Artemia franciscana TaxID=6661 RepID=A0AA88IK01_ARTSF|nr:hypothetical protein QYM36_003336 [Artemia franciscana]KAK2723112.1 hypothetical protein QYM36_003336 [Artemia franciscana]